MRRSIVISGVLVIVIGIMFILAAYVIYEEKKEHYAKKILGEDWERRLDQDPEVALEEIKEEMEKDKTAMILIDIFRVVGWGSVIVGVITLIAGLGMEEKDTGSEEEDEEEEEERPLIDRSDRIPDRNYPDCPGCSRSLKFPFMPKNCPYCNEGLEETVKIWLRELDKDPEEPSSVGEEVEGDKITKEEITEIPDLYKIQCPACSHINSYENKLHHLECEKCLSILRIKYDRFHNPFISGHT
jgi:hypothetical protein